MSCENLQLIRNRSQADCKFSKPWLTVIEVEGLGAFGGVGRGAHAAVMAGYKSLIQIRWVQTLLWKLLFLRTITTQICSVNVTLPWKTRARAPTKTMGQAENQRILISRPSFYPKEFLLGKNNTNNFTSGKHHQVEPVKPLARLFFCASITLSKPGRENKRNFLSLSTY